jgi:hypothetical protein
MRFDSCAALRQFCKREIESAMWAFCRSNQGWEGKTEHAWDMRITFTVSMCRMDRYPNGNDWKHFVALTPRLMSQWSCSATLFK